MNVNDRVAEGRASGSMGIIMLEPAGVDVCITSRSLNLLTYSGSGEPLKVLCCIST